MTALGRRRSATLRAFARLPVGRVGLAGAAVVLALAIVGPPIFGAAATKLDVLAQNQGSSGAHLLGTDQLGRDVLARTLAATRTSISLAALASLIAVAGGLALGALATLASGRSRTLVLRAIDLLLAFPALLIAIFVSAIIGVGGTHAAIAIGIALLPQFARLGSSLGIAVAGSDFVVAARATGLRGVVVTGRYVLPAVAGPLTQIACSFLALSLVSVSSLSFLGLGVQPPGYDWGKMLSEGLRNVYVTPLAAIAPGVAIVLTGIAVALLGDGLTRATDPRLWTAAARRRRHRGSTPSTAPTPTTPVPAAPPLPSAAPPLPSAAPPAEAIVTARGLRVTFPSAHGDARCVREVDLAIHRGETVGVVGESGSGKSLTISALVGIVPAPGVVEAEEMRVFGVDPLSDRSARVRELLARKVAVVFQDPSSSLNPTLTIGYQLAESLRLHGGLSRREARRTATARLVEVGIASPQRVLRCRPHELSGGMRQRVMIAMGLAVEPELLIADEPTTALDLTTQAQIVRLLAEINRTRGVAIVLVSHDLSLVASICDRVLVMYGGRIMEELPSSALPDGARHPYTRALLAAEPRVDAASLPEGIAGDPPDPTALPPGCPFADRCALAMDVCRATPPPLAGAAERATACWALADAPVAAGEVG